MVTLGRTQVIEYTLLQQGIGRGFIPEAATAAFPRTLMSRHMAVLALSCRSLDLVKVPKICPQVNNAVCSTAVTYPTVSNVVCCCYSFE